MLIGYGHCSDEASSLSSQHVYSNGIAHTGVRELDCGLVQFMCCEQALRIVGAAANSGFRGRQTAGNGDVIVRLHLAAGGTTGCKNVCTLQPVV